MKTSIQLVQGYKMTSRAVEALLAASRTRYTQAHNGTNEVYNVGGHILVGMPALGRYLLAECNEWMIDAGMVDMPMIKRAHMAGGQHLRFFQVVTS